MQSFPQWRHPRERAFSSTKFTNFQKISKSLIFLRSISSNLTQIGQWVKKLLGKDCHWGRQTQIQSTHIAYTHSPNQVKITISLKGPPLYRSKQICTFRLPPHWKGRTCMVLYTDINTSQRQPDRREVIANFRGNVAGGVFNMS